MGKLQAFGIILEGQKSVYKPGDWIKGEVQILLKGDKDDIRGIKLACKGKSYTHWTESDGSDDEDYTWKIPYFKEEKLLEGAGKNDTGSKKVKLPAGDHRYPFQFQIPDTPLPPPFEGTVGWVRYYLKGVIDRPWKFDHSTKRYFTIMTERDLNKEEPSVLKEETDTTTKTMCCLCCESGPITMRGTIDKGGYVAGESILVTVEINNESGRDVLSLRAALYQKGTYRAMHGRKTHTRESKVKVAEVFFENCNESPVTFPNKPLPVPPVAPMSFERCPNIDVDYYVKIVADVSGTPIDVAVSFPVIIGTVPALPHLQKPAHGFYPPSQGAPYPPPGGAPYPPPQEALYPPAQPGYPPAQPGYPPAQPSYPSAPVDPGMSNYPAAAPDIAYPPPPTYEMAVEGEREIAGKASSFGTVMYAPMYPYYNPETLFPGGGGGAAVPAPSGYNAGGPVTQQPPAGSYPPPQMPQGEDGADEVKMKEYPPM